MIWSLYEEDVMKIVGCCLESAKKDMQVTNKILGLLKYYLNFDEIIWNLSDMLIASWGYGGGNSGLNKGAYELQLNTRKDACICVCKLPKFVINVLLLTVFDYALACMWFMID